LTNLEYGEPLACYAIRTPSDFVIHPSQCFLKLHTSPIPKTTLPGEGFD
jgi:hypothetical protein